MSEELEDGDGENADEAGLSIAAASAVGASCLACGMAVSGTFCANCGQKNDDLRRCSFILAREALRDTFGFDSRMWRTLGLLAISPGRVPKEFANGRRSRFTPPVRLFLVVSFLFFLAIGMTNTLFLAVDIQPTEGTSGVRLNVNAGEVVTPAGAVSCDLTAKLQFFVQEQDVNVSLERLGVCFSSVEAAVRTQMETTARAAGENSESNAGPQIVEAPDEDLVESLQVLERTFGGLTTAIENPRAFNDSFNRWLPRVMLLMTPVLALLLSLFIRGKDAMFFDHLVLSLYTHAVGFVVVGVVAILAQVGLPYAGSIATTVMAIYYVVAVKRAYGRGVFKTTFAVIGSGLLYFIILFAIVLAIVTRFVLGSA